MAALSVTATGCVTNAEGGTPEGWEPIIPDEVLEIAALVPEKVARDGVLTAGTNLPFAPFEFKDSPGP